MSRSMGSRRRSGGKCMDSSGRKQGRQVNFGFVWKWIRNDAYVKNGSKPMHQNSLCKICGVFGVNNSAGTCWKHECKYHAGEL